MSDVATDAFREILSRVPPDHLPPLRRVCKEWRSIIDDPLFVDQLDGGDRFVICKPSRGSTGKLYSLYLTSLNNSQNPTQTVYATNVKNLIRRGVSPVLDMPVPSCHGLILLSHYENRRTWTVWNPFTKDFLQLPPFHNLTRGHFTSGGIGYDAVLGEYKVVRISGPLDESLETLIYSVKSNSWRRIDDYPDCIFKGFLSGVDKTENGVFFNGSLHWFASIEKVGRILALDLGTEKYHQIPAPPASSSGYWRMDASGGCLFVSYSYQERFDIWMLNDQGGENIWNKFVSLDQSNLGIRLWRPEVISYSKSKNEVVIRSMDGLLWCQVETKCGTKVSIQGVGDGYTCQAIRPSFIRLDGSRNANEIAALKKRKRKGPSDRLALKLIARHFDAEDSFDSSAAWSWSDSSDYFSWSESDDYED